MELRFDDRGLVPAIAQDHLTGEVRMVAWMNREALERTLASGKATFFSRSRGELWEKGATSGHALRVTAFRADCDADVVLLGVAPVGPSCHTGAPSCFFRGITGAGEATAGPEPPLPTLAAVERILSERASATASTSYTRHLLDGGPVALATKLREEVEELARALEGETDARVASEAADVMFHLMVALRTRGLDLAAVLAELERRRGTGGHEEKARRVGSLVG